MSLIDKEVLLSTLRELLNSTAPARNVVHRHGRSYRGYFQSAKAFEGPIPFESGLARDALRMFELATEVTMIVPEPFVLPYELDGEIHSYTPDYLLFLRDGSRAVVEIKWQAEADRLHNQHRFEAIRKLMASANALFATLTETTLRDTTLQRNMSLIESHKNLRIPSVIVGQLLGYLRGGSVSLGSLGKRIGHPDMVLAAIGQGILATNLRAPLTNDTPIRRA